MKFKEIIEFYKEKLLSNYWSEIKLIGYKIELLNKNKEMEINGNNCEELKSRIIYIGNKISGLIERRKRHCFNCSVTQTSKWNKYLNNNYLCNTCRHKHETKVHNELGDRKCFNCGITKTSSWRRHSDNNEYLCNACGHKHKTKVHNELEDKKCYTCGITQTSTWRRHSESKKDLCNTCGKKQRINNAKSKMLIKKNNQK
uniref:GATA-type domain-containing protein n=1 Tax=Meloidogyne hapla TaxID=6305 RepID=A0A1I8BRV5_MELHA